MKRTACVLASCLIRVSLLLLMITLSTDQNNKGSSILSSRITPSSDDLKIIGALKNERVVMFYRWQVNEDGEELSCLVRSFDSEPKWLGTVEKLSIFDKTGKLLYEVTEGNIWDLSSAFALRTGARQLIYRYDSGGSGMYFFNMLDYQNGEIVELLKLCDNDFDSIAEVRPSFRKEVTSAKEPFQIFLSKGFGLASPFRKDTYVYRYKDGSYRLAGKFSQQKVDDYIEELITNRARRNKRDR
ncbi:MAG: hypothetical protein MOB07_06790 [Acidobacteria bacterium]|nr:hypothetical protein [Acidobacteriota bacterium]